MNLRNPSFYLPYPYNLDLEIYWNTKYVQHILENYISEVEKPTSQNNHPLHFEEIW